MTSKISRVTNLDFGFRRNDGREITSRRPKPALFRLASSRLLSLLLLAFACLPLSSFAEQRALLVGVGKYVTPGIDLPGIDLDLERMRDTLKLMGFEDRQIHTLQDDAATSTNVIAEFESWLKQGVQLNDRVVFYFSGHGSNVPDLNGDEEDGVDEVLVTHDMKLTRVKGRASLTGVIVDDKLGELLGAIPSKNIWVVVDACHSGTVTRSFSMRNRSLGAEPVYVKSFNYSGMPEPHRRGLSRDIKRAPQFNYVSLTAAADDEKAIGTSHGGIFTIGLTESFKRMATEGKSITVNELRRDAADYIRSKVDKDQVHTPQVMGNSALADSALTVASSNVANGPNRKRLLELAAAQPKRFEIKASNSKYAIDEPVKMTLTLPAAGYLNLVSVDSKDNATVLFPNRYQESNAVSAGPFAVPTPQMAFELLASEPTGPTLVVAFLSSDPINFYQETIDDRDQAGHITADFSSLSHTATRAIRIAPKKNETYAAQMELDVVEAAH